MCFTDFKIKLVQSLSVQYMLTFSIFLFSENGPLSSRKTFNVSNYSSALIFQQNCEERIIYPFQSIKYWCRPHVSKIVGVPNSLTS